LRIRDRATRRPPLQIRVSSSRPLGSCTARLQVLWCATTTIDRGSTATTPKTAAFYSVNEDKKAPGNGVHHDNSACPPGRDIPANERRQGTNNYRLRHDYKTLNNQNR